MQPLEQIEDARAAGGIQISGRFIRQDHTRIVHQGAGDGDPLSLTAAQFPGPMVGPIPQTDLIEKLVGSLAPARRGGQ